MSSNNPAPAPVQASVVEPVQDIKPLDFDTSAFTTTTTAQPEPSIEVQSLDFDISSLNTPTAEPAKPLLKNLNRSISVHFFRKHACSTSRNFCSRHPTFRFFVQSRHSAYNNARSRNFAALLRMNVLNLHLIFQANPRLKLAKDIPAFLSIRLVQVKR